MTNPRTACALALLLNATASHIAAAQWTAIRLHSENFPLGSTAGAASGDWQGGSAGVNNHTQPILWHSSSGGFVNLVQSPTDSGFVGGIYGDRQVGQLNGHASIWSYTPGSRVDLHPPGFELSAANAIWEGGQVGNVSRSGQTFNNAALWRGSAASFVNLDPALSLGSEAYAAAAGQQGGFVYFAGPESTRVQHAALWSGSAASFVDLNPPGFESSIGGMWPGQQVGTFGGAAHVAHAALWHGTAASIIDLAPPNSSYSTALATCGSAQVGWAGLVAGNHAVIWFGSAQSYIDLGALLPAGLYRDSVAYGVSFFGGQYYVAGSARRLSTQESEAFLWVGIPAPASSIVLFGALVATLRRRRSPPRSGTHKPLISTSSRSYDTATSPGAENPYHSSRHSGSPLAWNARTPCPGTSTRTVYAPVDPGPTSVSTLIRTHCSNGTTISR